ncbi:MAG: trypsin-like peptidase domain-containing protein [Verrucomicrobiales bacterium]|nr:trypsin-like peptidase domain-containing protein [Verrucomicrobiales bacterium]
MKKRSISELNKAPRWLIANLLLVSVILSSSLSPVNAKERKITPESLRVTETKIQHLAKKNMSATVAIIPAVRSRMMGSGSGVIVSKDGLILTAAHVTTGMNNRVIVIFPDGKRAKGKVLGMDYSRDSGMVQITDPGVYPFAELGDSDSMKVNDWCVALGHAGGYQHDRTPPLRLGRIIRSNPNGFITSDSALISGDSGGPLFDEEGRVIGIHSNIGMTLSQNNHVPISTFIENWKRLKSGERFGGDDDNALLVNPDQPMIGAMLVDSANDSGAMIDSIRKGSPADKAGLKKGDKIIKAGAVSIPDSNKLIAEIRKKRSGDVIKMVVDSKGRRKTVSVELASAGELGAGSAGNGPLRKLPKRTPEEVRELQAEFNRIMRDSIKERKLKLTDQFYDKFRSAAEFNQFMNRFKKTLTPKEKETLIEVATVEPPEPIRPGTFDPDRQYDIDEEFFRDVLNSFQPSTSAASNATHMVFRGQEWKSLCTVLTGDGYAITKASEIDTQNNQKLGVLIAKGQLVPAKVIKTYQKHDLALIKIQKQNGLKTVKMDNYRDLDPGSMIAAPGTGPDPVAIGLVSVLPRSLTGENKGFLGIGTAHHDKGVEVTMVIKEASAGIAGIRRGDVIMKIDDAVCDTPEKLIRLISSKTPGTNIILQLIRNGRGTSVKVKLGNRADLDDGRPDPNGRMNRMGTNVNKLSSGFPRITQTDLPILPQHCGGPVVDLDGNVIGINIARAGRIKSYMIPADEINRLVVPDLPSKVSMRP